MGSHGGANARLRASDDNRRPKTSTTFNLPGSRAFTLQNWPVSLRLFAVIMLTLGMGLVFGGVRVAGAARDLAHGAVWERLTELHRSGRFRCAGAGPDRGRCIGKADKRENRGRGPDRDLHGGPEGSWPLGSTNSATDRERHPVGRSVPAPAQ